VSRHLNPPSAPELDQPRSNGELVFAAPWESRVFGMVSAYLDRTGQPWEAFRQRLIAAIADGRDGESYYESFTAAFESLLAADGVLSRGAADPLR
jgi:hypothetical protein